MFVGFRALANSRMLDFRGNENGYHYVREMCPCIYIHIYIYIYIYMHIYIMNSEYMENGS